VARHRRHLDLPLVALTDGIGVAPGFLIVTERRIDCTLCSR
jgi:hypothetical protein